MNKWRVTEFCTTGYFYCHNKKHLDHSCVYIQEVDRVRNHLTEADRVEFDNLMPTQKTLSSAITITEGFSFGPFAITLIIL